MNRLVASFAALLLAASVFGGCTPKETPPQGEPSGSSSQVEENNSSQEDSSSRRLTVADAALYRGEVRGLDENGFYLVQVPGRDYGDGIVRFSIGEGTKFSFDRETLEEGQYLEVYYSDVQETYPPQTEAIAVNRLPDAAMSVFNGEVVEVTEKEDGTTDLLMKRIGGEGTDEILFHIGESTQVYTNEIQVGSQLSILFNGSVTLSLPGQASAWEVAPYTVEKSEDYTQWIGSK